MLFYLGIEALPQNSWAGSGTQFSGVLDLLGFRPYTEKEIELMSSSSLEWQYGEIPISGFTKHGINQAISRDGVGVGYGAILDAVKNPIKTAQQAEGKIKYIGQNATVILNQAGEVITTWSRNIFGWRIR